MANNHFGKLFYKVRIWTTNGQLSFLQICVSVISFNLVLLIQTICSQIIVIDNYFANFSNFVLQIFVQDKFCILLFHIDFICKLSFQTFFCHKLFLSCGLGQGCPGGPDLQDLNQQIIWKSWDVAPVAAQHGENRAVFCSGKFAKSIISSSKSLGFHVKHSSALNAVWAGLEIQAIFLKNGILSQQGLPLQDAFVWHLTIRDLHHATIISGINNSGNLAVRWINNDSWQLTLLYCSLNDTPQLNVSTPQ